MTEKKVMLFMVFFDVPSTFPIDCEDFAECDQWSPLGLGILDLSIDENIYLINGRSQIFKIVQSWSP